MAASAKSTATWWNARPRRSATCSTAASRPSRTIADPVAARARPRRGRARRGRPSQPRSRCLAHHGEELLLHERVQAAGRLVEDEQLGVVEERLDQADLLPVAARELARAGGRGPRRSARPARRADPSPATPRTAAQKRTSSRPVTRGSHVNSPAAHAPPLPGGRAAAWATLHANTYPRIRARAALLWGARRAARPGRPRASGTRGVGGDVVERDLQLTPSGSSTACGTGPPPRSTSATDDHLQDAGRGQVEPRAARGPGSADPATARRVRAGAAPTPVEAPSTRAHERIDVGEGGHGREATPGPDTPDPETTHSGPYYRPCPHCVPTVKTPT